MPLKQPTYIPVGQIAHSDIPHRWNDWDPYEPIGWPDENTKNVLRKVSNHGITAFSIGCAEWVVYRFATLSSDRTPYNYIEAYWLYVMGNDSALPPQTDHADWPGPIRGPMNLALMTTLSTVYRRLYGPTVQNGALSAQIALHVLIDKIPFLEWEEKILNRLLTYCSRDERDPDGASVPREILDPSVDLTSANWDRLIEDFLRSADYRSNPFIAHLRPPNSHDAH